MQIVLFIMFSLPVFILARYAAHVLRSGPMKPDWDSPHNQHYAPATWCS